MKHSKTAFIDQTKWTGNFPCSWCSRILTKKGSKTSHEKHCKANPNSIPGSKAGIPRTPAEKMLLSAAMKKRHADGRAAKWKNPSLYESYAEKFFQKVIDNEFLDKQVIRELPLEKYSFDFAWPHKMKAIEIDGQQHERYQHQRESDKRKDNLALEKGWTVLRIKWRELYAEPKKFISIANNFIGD